MIPTYLLPEHYQCSAFIAGGYAACPALATDVDVWVTVDKAYLDEACDEIIAHLRTLDSVHVTFITQPGSDERVDISATHYPLFIDNRKVAVVDIFGHAKPYHIIVTSGTVYNVLSGFDISTHQVALTSLGVIVGPDFTAPHELPYVIKDTPTTAERLRKVTARYSTTFKEIACPLIDVSNPTGETSSSSPTTSDIVSSGAPTGRRKPARTTSGSQPQVPSRSSRSTSALRA